MKFRLAIAALIFLLVASTAAAQQNIQQPNTSAQVETPTLNLTQLQSRYNQNSDQIPGFVGSIIGDQTITVNLSEMETGSEMLEEDVIGVKTNGVKTEDLQWGEFEDPTLKIWITQENVETLSEAEDTPQKLKEMMKNDEIRYETYSFGNAVKFGIMELFISF